MRIDELETDDSVLDAIHTLANRLSDPEVTLSLVRVVSTARYGAVARARMRIENDVEEGARV